MKQKTTEELLERRTQIASEIEVEGADLDALEAEVRAINDELETRKQAEDQRRELRKAVADGDGEPIKTFEEKEKTMNIKELRSSKEYLNAWVEGIKTGRYDECRKLFTENVSDSYATATDGVVPVPTYVEGRINGMFERNELLRRIRRTFFRGNVKVGFEVSSNGAQFHSEGAPAINDEQLVIGTVSIIGEMIKKTILVSDELIDMHGEEFLDYLFDEFENKIEAKLAERVISAINLAPAASHNDAVGVPSIEANAVTLDLVARALGLITESVPNACIVMNRASYPAFRAAQLNGNYAVDPFEGLPIVYDNSLASITDAQEGDTWLIVGDLDAVQANFPGGDQVKFIYDPFTQAPADLVRLTGRLYVGVGITAPGKLAKVVKGA